MQLKASDAGVESLGSIVGHSVLQAALKQCVMDSDVICIGSDARSITSRPPAAAAAAGHVLSAGDFSVSCALLVGADGAASRVRAHSGIGRASAHVCLQSSVDISTLILFAASAAMNYSSRAVVATLQVTIWIIHVIRKNSHVCLQLSESTSTAHQRFLSTGPIAMLPMDAGFASLVWTLPARQAAQAVIVRSCMLRIRSDTSQVLLPADELVTLINEAFRAGHEGAAVLPPLVTGIEGKTAAVPLQLMQACRMQENSIVLVGDAAHAVHPLAGQGLNLGLHDALSLVAHISRASSAGGAADDFVALQARFYIFFPPQHIDTMQAYERERLPANAAWGAAIDFIGRTFGVQASAFALPRSFALSFLNAATPLKQQIILAASGEGSRHFENLEELK